MFVGGGWGVGKGKRTTRMYSRRAVRRCARCSTASTGGRVQWSARVECLPARGAQVGRSRVAYWTAHLCRIHFRQRARKIRYRRGRCDVAANAARARNTFYLYPSHAS